MQNLTPVRPSLRALAFAAGASLAVALVGCVNPNAIGVQDTGSIIGRVIDAKTQQPIANAIVSVNSIVGTHTDAGGAFAVLNVPVGIQQVTVRANGYATYTSGDIRVVKDTPSNAELIALQPLNGP